MLAFGSCESSFALRPKQAEDSVHQQRPNWKFVVHLPWSVDIRNQRWVRVLEELN